MSRTVISLIAAVTCFVSACNSRQEQERAIILAAKEQSFATHVPSLTSSDRVEIRPVLEESGISGAGTPRLVFEVDNVSPDILVFPFDFGVKALRYDEAVNSWVEDANLVSYAAKEDLILYPKGGMAVSYASGGVIPDYKPSGQAVTYRIIIRGRVMGSDMPIVAYIEFNLPP